MTTDEERKADEQRKSSIWLKLVRYHVKHCYLMLTLIAIGTIFFSYEMLGLKINTDFFQLYPPKHPYIQLYKEYRKMFGTANVMSVILEVKNGNIYNLETLKKLDFMTQEILAMKGVNPYQTVSLAHPKVKNITVGHGIIIEPLMKPFPETNEDLRKLKEKVYSNEGVRGLYVTPNDKAALILAGFWEEGVNLRALYKNMMELKNKMEDANHAIYITGYPMLYAWITHYEPQLLGIFIVVMIVSVILLWWYFRSFMGVFIPMMSMILSAIWGLGFAALLNINIDPLILVIPLLLSARAKSHSVQSMERYHEEYAAIGDKKEAIIRAYGYLYKPGILGTICDGLGVLTIAVMSIPLMRNLAIYGSFWIFTIYVSSIVFHPCMVSLLPPPRAKHIDKEKLKGLDRDTTREELRLITARPGDKFYLAIGRFLITLTKGNRKWAVFAITMIIIFGGGYLTRTMLKVGDVSAGKAILYPDHPYNVAYDKVNKEFLGATQMIVIAEGKKKGAMTDANSLRLLEDLQVSSLNIPAVGGTLTITDMIKRIFRMFHEGDPKWDVLPEESTHLAQTFYLIGASTAPGEMERFISVPDYTNATVTLYFRDYNNKIISDAISYVKNYTKENPAKEMTFRLCGGLIGILAAVNEEVEWSYWVNMILIFSFTFLFCTWGYRSFWGALVLFVPLLASQVCSDLLMLILGIDLNINSLPVCSVGVGVGVDYGQYILSRLAEEYQFSNGDYEKARYLALTSTGKAVIFTSSTLLLSIIFFVYGSFKFQAEMSILLSFLLVANMVGALAVLPSLVSIIGPERILMKYKV